MTRAFCFVLFCFVLFCFILFCFVLFYFVFVSLAFAAHRLEFSVGENPVEKFRMIERHYFRDE